MNLPSPDFLLAAADDGRSISPQAADLASTRDIDAAFAIQAAIGALRRRR